MSSPGNVAKIDHLMSSARDLPVPPAGVSLRYLICSTARCGSNLVGDFLHGTGLAGDPLEYLNGRFMAGFLRSQGLPPAHRLDVHKYLAAMEHRRTSPNGCFGLKMHYEHLQALFARDRSQVPAFLSRFQKLIVLRRRDKLAQAVSLHRARVTQLWTSEDARFLPADDPRLHRPVPFDPPALARALYDIVAQEEGWEQTLKQAGQPFSVFWYEDFVADRTAAGTALLQTLGLPCDKAVLPEVASVRRQGSDDDPMLSAWRGYLGCRTRTGEGS